MALEISSLDLHYLVSEMGFLRGAKVDKIMQPAKEEVVFQFYVMNKGKHMLRIALPSIIHLAGKKPGIPEKLFGFCSALRKYLSNARLESIEQIDSERIVRLAFKKEDEFVVIIELFAKGNIILCKKDLSIIVPLRTRKFKEYNIIAGAKYTFPDKRVNFLELSADKLNNILKKSKQTISKTLAVDLGFGGLYSKEICLLSGIGEKETLIDKTQIKTLLKTIKDITNKKISPSILSLENKPMPFELEIYKEKEKLKQKTFNSAVESVFQSQIKKPITKKQKELQKLQKIIEKQKAKIKELKSAAEEGQRHGEMIYEKYQILQGIITEIRKAREKHSWKEIKEKLKGHKLIKEVNEKKGEITVEL